MESSVIPKLGDQMGQGKQPEGSQGNTVTLSLPISQRPTNWQVTFRLVGFEGQGSSVLHVIQAGWLATTLLSISEAKDKWGRNMSLNRKTFRQRHGKFKKKKKRLLRMRVLPHSLRVKECLVEGGNY